MLAAVSRVAMSRVIVCGCGIECYCEGNVDVKKVSGWFCRR